MKQRKSKQKMKKKIHCTCTCKIVGKSTLSHTSNLVKLVPPSFSKACAESMYLQKKKKKEKRQN